MTIADIKSRLPIREVLARYGYPVQESGRMACPFHEDRSPSFQVFSDTQRYRCFAQGCQAGGGDIFDLIERLEHCSKAEAIARAQAWAEGVTPSAVAEAKAPEVEAAARLFVVGQLMDRFQESFGRSGKAQSYLQGRGLDLARLQEWGVRLGYNTGRWMQQETAALLEQAQAVGLIDSQGRAFARGCVVVPLLDEAGQAVSLYGRSILAGSGKHFYQRGRRGLFPGYPDPAARRVLLCESILDAMSLLVLDLPSDTSVLSLYGTEGFTGEHRQALEPLLGGGVEVVLCLDGDAAGQAATERIAQELRQLGACSLSRLVLPEGQDVNEVLATEGAQALASMLEERLPLLQQEESALPDQGRLDTTDRQYLIYQEEGFRVSVPGGVKLTALESLRVSLVIEHLGGGQLPLRDRCDLYQRSAVMSLCRHGAQALDVREQQLQELLSRLAGALEDYRMSEREAQQREQQPAKPTLTQSERQQALDYLSRPDLMQRTQEDIGRSGVVGEELSRLLLYLVLTSRLRERPLHAICLGESGTGKTYLQERVARLIPEEDRLELSALSENALYYFPRGALRHKALLIEDLDGLDGVLYPLRELQSKGRLSKSLALKDAQGQIQTVTVEVEGPVATSGCTTQESLYEDNANRALLIYLDGSPDQQQAILDYQRRLSSGAVSRREQEQVAHLLRNAQRLLRPVRIHNPWAEQLSLPPLVRGPLRSNGLYLGLIETITFYHQYSRPWQEDGSGGRYLETSLEDVRWANRLMASVLAVKSDELSGATRSFLERLKQWLKEQQQETFFARDLRFALRMSPATLKRHLWQLQEYGFLEMVGGNRYRRGYQYQLSAEGDLSPLESSVSRFLEAQVAGLEASKKG